MPGHDRRANDQQEEPDPVQETREPNPGAIIRPGDRLQHRQHRRSRSHEGLASPGPGPPLANHTNRPVQSDHPGELPRPGHPATRWRTHRGSSEIIARVDPAQMGEPSPGERWYRQAMPQLPVGHHRLGDLHVPHQANCTEHSRGDAGSSDGAEPHVPSGNYAATGGQVGLS